MRSRSKKPDFQSKIAKERIQILFDLAEKELKKHPERSRRYVELARKIGLRYNIRLGKVKKGFCKKCNTVLKPGFTSEVRLDSKNKVVETTCLNCNQITRIPYSKK